MEVTMSSGLWDVLTVHQEHRMIVVYLVQKSPLDGLAVKRPADGAVGAGTSAVNVLRDPIAILGDDTGELDVEEPEQASIARLTGLLVSIDLVAEQKGKRHGVIVPRIEIASFCDSGPH
jgi:hypothetical protein